MLSIYFVKELSLISNMWQQVTYVLKNPGGNRNLIILSNFVKDESGHEHDSGKYTIYEDLTPYEDMTTEEIWEHHRKAGHWDADPYLEEHCTFLGKLQIQLNNLIDPVWTGKPGDFTDAQLFEIGRFLLEADFIDPGFDEGIEDDGLYIGEDSITKISTFELGDPLGLQKDGRITFFETYKTNTILVTLKPNESGYDIVFDDEVVGKLHMDAKAAWRSEYQKFNDPELLVRIIDQAEQYNRQ